MLDLTHKKFGLLVVINEAPKRNGRRAWYCRCSCGNELSTLQSSLRKGATISCGCRKKELGNGNPNWTGYEGITGSQWALMKNNAKNRKIPFDITIQEAWQLFIKQKRRCALTGIELIFSKSYNRKLKFSNPQETTASLDRIDSSKGYTKYNVQWVHKDINWMKNNFSEVRFVELCKLVTDYSRIK